MITRRTRLQLLVFVAITLLGVSYVGARYARLDRVFFDDHYTVVAHLERSGGIYEGGEVSYRGVQVGSVGKLVLTDDGVDAYLDIDNSDDDIPADTLAVVGNRSAVGEQYVELQPRTDKAPYLGENSEIAMADTRTPIATEKFLGDISDTVESVDKDALATTVDELGQAFAGTGTDLQRIIDTGNSFINEADANFETTTALIRDSNTVLQTQSDKASAIRTFAQQLSLFTGSLAGSDKDLREVIDQGSATATQLRTFLEDNRVDLAELLNNLVTTGDVIVKHLPGIEQILVVYPYVVEGGFTVVSKSPDTGLYDAHFGLILTNNPVCHRGYESTDTRPPQDGSNRPMNTKAGCTEPASQSNPRGVQNLKRAGAAYRPPPVASYDPDSGRLRWGGQVSAASSQPGTLAPKSFGEDTWKWLYLQPLTESQK
ncbi:virulence factor Mce [Nocardioides sp. Root1257]|uniref:MCE family protein n=1 Tax=unclassified Nocardioides TaxID=2615069 RepID=UPI0006FEC17B|nr:MULTISPECIES: MlaD family protein [unclassified Nocardioides]KQW46876.1 virulence factor Mce [Nocardioides sp. Root1257]KRC43623.1 virulence factor Mce [Nocardioides sp. Root224]